MTSISTTAVPKHGNYRGYYTKRPYIRDPRLALLPPEIFSGAKVLDVGCNEGWVACEIAQLWGAHKVVGVDIDDYLVRGAWKKRRTAWSLAAPAEDMTEEEKHQTGKLKRDPSEEHSVKLVMSRPDYFPMSCEHEFGPLPIPPSKIRGRYNFPHNLSFRTADWITTSIPEDVERYDVVLAFSISKWIHLNGGDDAIKIFFQRVHAVLESGGVFLLEPQAWDTYAKAKRMNQTLKENSRDLRIRPEGFEVILRGIGFGPAQHFGITGEGGFRRPIDLYTKV